jgi:hypothetical protein
MRRIAYITLGLGLVALVTATTCTKGFRSQDEGPIIVQNGSMTIDTVTDAEWKEDGGNWSNETGKDHQGDLWVRVEFTDGTICSNHGWPLQIDYSAGGFGATFTVGGNPKRTKVGPKGQLNNDTKQRLSHGSSGEYINGVKINGQTLPCTITQNNLKSIMVCSSPGVCK